MNKPHAFVSWGLLLGWTLATSGLAAEAPPSRPTINVKDFGAKGDCQRAADGVMRKEFQRS